MTSRKKVRDQDKKLPDQGAVEAAMRALPLWLPSDVCDGYTRSRREICLYGIRSPSRPDPAYAKTIQIRAFEDREGEPRVVRKTNEDAMAIDRGMEFLHVSNGAPSRSSNPDAWGNRTFDGIAERAFCANATPQNSAKLHMGPDRKQITLKFAKAAACDFHSLTGKKPTGSGNRDEFPEFLSAVFKALNMDDDSVEHFARKASSWWDKEGSNEVMEALRATMLKPIRVANDDFSKKSPSMSEAKFCSSRTPSARWSIN